MTMSDFQIFECTIGEGENSTKLAIIKGGMNSFDPIRCMNEVVAQYVKNTPHNQFIEIGIGGDPCTRIIIENCTKLPLMTMKQFERNEKLDKIIN
jgi:hypothetical protein